MKWFPKYPDPAADPARSRWTLHHVLSMTMGTDLQINSCPTTIRPTATLAMDMAPDRYLPYLDRPLVTEPGKNWVYNGGATRVAGPADRQGYRKIAA